MSYFDDPPAKRKRGPDPYDDMEYPSQGRPLMLQDLKWFKRKPKAAANLQNNKNLLSLDHNRTVIDPHLPLTLLSPVPSRLIWPNKIYLHLVRYKLWVAPAVESSTTVSTELDDNDESATLPSSAELPLNRTNEQQQSNESQVDINSVQESQPLESSNEQQDSNESEVDINSVQEWQITEDSRLGGPSITPSDDNTDQQQPEESYAEIDDQGPILKGSFSEAQYVSQDPVSEAPSAAPSTPMSPTSLELNDQEIHERPSAVTATEFPSNVTATTISANEFNNFIAQLPPQRPLPVFVPIWDHIRWNYPDFSMDNYNSHHCYNYNVQPVNSFSDDMVNNDVDEGY
ncbi:hypothetical protein HDU76_013285 [Blyttiomyces sp. JEL0837]|nr:hypothetical protein HDU76_013285 [Blyttiomyces sp. JEL0837]